jgi:putative nucleotidyltransferase with HDIG domain
MKNKLNLTQSCRDALRIMLNLSDAGHSVEHVVRVYDWCRKLARHYPQTDLKVLKVAAYWHDVGRTKQSEDKDDHNIKSAQMVEQYLKKHHAPEVFNKKVKNTVLYHSFRFKPRTIEGKILHDADKLSIMSNHDLLDTLEGYQEGFSSKTFAAQDMINFLKYALSKTKKGVTHLEAGLLLPQTKKIYRRRQKQIFQIAKIIYASS